MNALETFIKENNADMLLDLTQIVNACKHQLSGSGETMQFKDHVDDIPSIDVRLCIDFEEPTQCESCGSTGCVMCYGTGINQEPNGTWIFRTGLVDYDQVHSEYCTASCITLETKPNELLNELVDQILNGE